MSCKSYRDALIETAASRTEPEAALRAHLASCADCRTAFGQEQLLFSSIDAGLHVSANAAVPVSLLPRVRAGIEEMPAGKSVWNTRWVALVTAAVIVAGVFAVRSAWHKDVVQSPVETGKTIAAPQVTRPLASQDQSTAAQVAANSGSRVRMPGSTLSVKAAAQINSAPEVLVPKDQELLLAEYAEEWRRRKGTLVLAQTFDATVFPPLEVAPIQIDELDVKPLAENEMK